MNTANFLSIPSTMFPDQEILVFEGTRLTYGQELERVRRLASMLRDLGIKPGDRVAMLQTNSHQFIEAYYATATLGATFVPLNYRAKPPELEKPTAHHSPFFRIDEAAFATGVRVLAGSAVRLAERESLG